MRISDWSSDVCSSDLVAYTKVKIDRLTIPASLLAAYTSEGLEGSLAQTVIPFQPKWQANASFDYKIADVMMDTSLILNGDLHYQTSYRAGDITIPGYKTVDLRATLAGMFGGGVDISIFVKNLFDVTYETGPDRKSTRLNSSH